jgi:hypothetical protein
VSSDFVGRRAVACGVQDHGHLGERGFQIVLGRHFAGALHRTGGEQIDALTVITHAPIGMF